MSNAKDQKNEELVKAYRLGATVERERIIDMLEDYDNTDWIIEVIKGENDEG